MKTFILIILVSVGNIITYANTYTLTSPNPVTNSAYSVEDMVTLDYGSLYYLLRDKEEGIIGTINVGGRITVRVFDYDENKPGGKGLEVYELFLTSTSSTYSGGPEAENLFFYSYGTENYVVFAPYAINSNDVLRRAQDAFVYAPNTCWEKRTWSDWMRSYIYRDKVFPACRRYMLPVQPVIVEIEVSHGTFTQSKIPGIGVCLPTSDGKVTVDNSGDYFKYCADNTNNTKLCEIYDHLRNPNPLIEDILIAAHRGWWGYNLGQGAPENSLEAVKGAHRQDIDIVEMDLTITVDNQLVFMHDYVMKRLTNYSGGMYSFQMAWDDIKDFSVRRRDGTVVPNQPLSRFEDVLQYVKDNDMVMMVDVKEQQSKGGPDNCLDNCGFVSPDSRKLSWLTIVRQCLRQAHSLGARKNLIIKTYYSYDEIYSMLGSSISSVLWTPMLVPNNFRDANGEQNITLMTDFIDDWNQKGSTIIACFETNFFSPDGAMLAPFSAGGTNYQNLLHYIFATTGRRSGVFSEEPASALGTVNRWGAWKMKNTETDIRGDFMFLLNLHYGGQMVITTDRLDVWKEIKQKF